MKSEYDLFKASAETNRRGFFVLWKSCYMKNLAFPCKRGYYFNSWWRKIPYFPKKWWKVVIIMWKKLPPNRVIHI